MSYDIYLIERVSGEPILLPIKHVMTGGTYHADYNPATDTFTPAATNEAWLNITYNYSRYYYEATENDDRFYGMELYGDKKYCNLGIRGIYGKTGLESIAMLNDMILRIESRYKKNNEWITTKRVKSKFKDRNGNERNSMDLFMHDEDFTEENYEVDVSEGPNDDYWTETAANALKPLYQLLVFAKLRPDGVWDGD